MTKKRYVVYLVVSGIFTLALLVKLCPLFPSNLYVVLDLIAMLGGGVFCSTLVSWFVEAQNKKREIQSQEKQREYILASVKSSFLRLYERELHEFSGYYNKYIAKNSANWVREELQITAIAQKLTWLINKFEEEKNNESSSEVITISLDYLKHRDDQNRALVSRNQLYYKSLHKHLLELSSHYSTYLISGIFSEQQIDALKSLTFDIQDILVFAPEDALGDGSILELKKILFEKTSEILSALNIPVEASVHVHYRNVF